MGTPVTFGLYPSASIVIRILPSFYTLNPKRCCNNRQEGKHSLGFSADEEYNAHVNDNVITRRLPSPERLSIVLAVIMLAYVLNRFMDIPSQTVAIQTPGFFLEFKFNDSILTALLVAGLSATGADWILRDHTSRRHQLLFPHLLLPAVTALVIGIPLNQMDYGITWWAGLIAGMLLLVMVFVAEYIVMDGQDARQPFAAASLSAVSFVIYLVLATALRASGTRLFFILPALILATWLVSLRSLNLRLHGMWVFYECMIIALVVGQLAAAIHYWPLAPIRFGLILLGPAYALTSLFSGLIEEKPAHKLVVEPTIVLGLSWLGAVILA